MKPFSILASACLCFGLSSGSAFASITLVQATGSNYVYSVTHPTEPWVVFVNPADEVTYQSSASQDMRNALAAEFSGWSFSYYGGLAGTMTINFYKAAIDGGSGGAMISATYQPDAEDPPNLTFIQLITTDAPLNGATSPYIDPHPNDDNLPFYWTASELADHTDTSGAIAFSDFSKRPAPTDPFSGKAWSGELLLASWVGGSGTTVYVYDGFVWGWGIYRGADPPQAASRAEPTANPEPSSIGLGTIGIACWLAVTRRRKQSSVSSNWHRRVLAPFHTSLALCCAAGLILGGKTISARDQNPPSDPQGVTYTASLSKAVFQRGEPVRLKLQFRNLTTEPMTVWLSGFWSNHQVSVTDESGVEPPLTALGRSARDAFAPGGGRDKNSPVVLRAGDVYLEKTDLDLARLYCLGLGRYKVKVIYHDLQAPTPMRLTTETLTFELRE